MEDSPKNITLIKRQKKRFNFLRKSKKSKISQKNGDSMNSEEIDLIQNHEKNG